MGAKGTVGIRPWGGSGLMCCKKGTEKMVAGWYTVW